MTCTTCLAVALAAGLSAGSAVLLAHPERAVDPGVYAMRALEGGSAQPRPLPDLAIAGASEVPSAPTRLRVRVINKGTAASAATRLTLFHQRHGKVMKVAADVPPLEPGTSRDVAVDAGSPLAQATHLTLRVDEPPIIEELDELNNTYTVK